MMNFMKKKFLRAGDGSSQDGYAGPREKASTGWTISLTRTRKDVSDAHLQYA